jgi:hypothetical protein
MSFKNIKGGDRVYYRERDGFLGELKVKSGVANALLLFADHVVVNIGGKYGTPKVVDAFNFERVKPKAVRVDACPVCRDRACETKSTECGS